MKLWRDWEKMSDKQQLENATWPTVTVVVATRDRRELLRQALDSIVGQTYPGVVECIVVFDQTEVDESLSQQGERRSIRVMANERTPGLAGARNTGILAAGGELVAFCDDDDRWAPEKLERQVPAMEGFAVSVTGIVIEYGGKETIRVPRQDEFTLENLVRTRIMAGHPSTVVFRRDAIDAIGLVDEEIPGSYGEDYDWMIRALQHGPVRVVEEPLVRVLWGQSMFSQKWQTIVDSIDYTLQKHEIFRKDNRALARKLGRRAFANAALGNRRQALVDAWRALRAYPKERRAYLAPVVASGLVSAEFVMRMANKRGRGI